MKKKILNIGWMFSLLTAALVTFSACEKDDDSNPTLDLSHAAEGFTLNVPANAANNVYDLVNATSLELTCAQPNYGGIPYVTRYYVQVAIDPAFLNDTTVAHKELSTSYTKAKMNVDALELNSAVVALFQEANPDTDYPNAARPVYVRLRAAIDAIAPYDGQSISYSNIITLPNVLATYKAPAAELPDKLFVIGSSIQTAWSSWKEVSPIFGLTGSYYTMIYVPAGGEFKWGTFNGDWRGFNRIRKITDNAGAEISESGDGNSNIIVKNGGWYTLVFEGEINGSSIQYDLTIYPGAAYVIGAGAGGDWTDGNAAWAMTAPADAATAWESPAFTATGELRTYIKVPGIDWWRTEFTIYKGTCYWRNIDIPDNWAANVGADYSVTVAPGQKLYVNFDTNAAEVK